MAIAESNAVVVALHGEIDMSNADGIAGAVALARQSSYSSVVFDFSDVTFMDVRGVRALIRAYQQVHQDDGELIVRHPCNAVRLVLDLTGASRIVRVEP
jgi:stage II sporulation protein AA (anti-sigma F factor antagonist)